jgi:hypothetical protein
MDSLERPKERKIGTEFGHIDSVAVQEVRWDRGDTQPADYTCSYGNWHENHELWTGFIVHQGTISAPNKIEFISDRISYGTLRGRWCDIIFLNLHAPKKDKTD